MSDEARRRARADAAAHLSRHAGMTADLKRDSDDLHRKMEAHGRALNEARKTDDPAVYAPGGSYGGTA